MTNTKIIVAYGDGIGPEIMEATLKILHAAKAPITVETIEIGERMYNTGYTSGITPAAMDAIKASGIFLKSPITTPQGKGYKSLNVTFRKALGLYANIRPIMAYHPVVKSIHQKMNCVIVRENEEDLYSGIEYRNTANTSLALKVISRMGCERIVRYAFDYAVANNRRKVTCMSKDNIMKITDGMFHVIFDHIKQEYPNIETDHYIIDIGSARIAARPSDFDVVVTLNLYGDIISDIAAEVSGSVGLAGSSNIGEKYAMFEAIHGSAPDIAGKDIANPSGLLNASIMMLEHIGEYSTGALVKNALLKTLEDGVHTADIFDEKLSKTKVGTKQFTDAVIGNLGQEPRMLPKAELSKAPPAKKTYSFDMAEQNEELVGADLYLEYKGGAFALANELSGISAQCLNLSQISAKGLKLWPSKDETFVNTDVFQVRYIKPEGKSVTMKDIAGLQSAIDDLGISVIMMHRLVIFDGMAGFTKAQGE